MKKILWGNLNIELTKDVKEFYKEELPEIYNKGEEYMLEDYMEMVNTTYLDDFYYEFDTILEGDIICIANLDLWNSKCSGYRIVGDNLTDITKAAVGDYQEFYYDGYNVRGTDAHHDGINEYLFRELRTDRNTDVFLEKIYNGEKINNNTLNYYTKSLRSEVKKILGI